MKITRKLTSYMYDRIAAKSNKMMDKIFHSFSEACSSLGFDGKELLQTSSFSNNILLTNDISVLSCVQSISSAVKQGHLIPDNIKSVCDFGTGNGLTAATLKKAFKLSDNNLVALEKTDRKMTDLLGTSQVLIGDGIKYLNEGSRKFDLITSCLLGPMKEGHTELLSNLLLSAPKSLNPNGKLLIYSDAISMDAATRFCKANKINFSHIKADNESKLMETFVFSNSELSKLKELKTPSSSAISRVYRAYFTRLGSSARKLDKRGFYN